ncbi:transcription elongation factor GreA [Pectinatus cerevisiiphilus]|uniref:Transcription elongation factor GreA n=1 Tax=Pectinatus cerevisiiphilus TaxID=86956 RepID=A0A4R3K5Y7_9FIRM|nr:transcription elongation factor GreA [Pectinatus cerevisiiphilus]TCS78185.1 transcription elongation factor GreA [Pectinatus cerevisiiphilus]
MAEKRSILTEEGLKKIEQQLENLKSVRRIEVAQRIKQAIDFGDISENSEYDDAKNEQAFIEGEILRLEKVLRESDVIHKTQGDGSGIIHLGNKVVICDLEYGENESYTIVGSAEADVMEGKISNESPVGAAILGHKIGDIVDVNVPAGVLKYKIVEVK